MVAYLIGTVRIKDPERFALYSAAIKGVAAVFGGEPVVAGPVAEVVEGNVQAGERVVVSRFPGVAEIHAYLSSPRYAAARTLREGAAEVDLRIVLA